MTTFFRLAANTRPRIIFPAAMADVIDVAAVFVILPCPFAPHALDKQHKIGIPWKMWNVTKKRLAARYDLASRLLARMHAYLLPPDWRVAIADIAGE